MASIKGIIVEIGGDTSGLQKALSKVNSSTSSLSRELRGINSLLKLDPKNTELVAQKQEVLKENIEQTSKKLEELQKVQEMANEKLKNGGEISQENYRTLQREIISTENKLKQLKTEASNWTKAGRSIEEFGNKITNISNKIDKMGTTLTTSLTLPIAGIATAAVTTGNTFEAQMSRVQAIAGATKDELKLLTEQAVQLGAETSFGATEVAQGMENLASAGFSTKEIMEAMPGMLDLAASSGADLANASEIAASAIRGFGLEASTATHIADVYAEAAARTNAQTEDMGEAMKYIAPVAKTMGLSLEEIAAAIGIMSDAGIKGSQAGTSLRGALTRLTKPTDKMDAVMRKLGLSFYDNNGKMKSLAEMTAMLQEKTKGLTDEEKQNALTVLFGTESLSGMLSLMNRGSDELSSMTKAFKECDGAASEMADTMLDNTSGAIEEMKGAFESAGIAIQQALAPEMKDLAKRIQSLVDDFNDLTDEEKQNIIKTVALVAAIGPAVKILGTLGKGLGTVTKGIGTFSKAIAVAKNNTTSTVPAVNKLANGMKFLVSPAGLATTAITALVAGLTYLAIKQANATKETKEFAEEIANQKQDYEEYNKSIDKTTKSNLAQINSVSQLREELKELVDENGKVKKGYESRVAFILNQLNEALGTEYKLNGDIVQSYKELQSEIDKTIEKKKAEILLNASEEKYKNAVEKETEAVTKLKEAHDELGMSIEDARKKQEELNNKLKDFEKAGDIYNSEYFDTGSQKKNLENLIKAYEDSESIVKQCVKDKKSYETDYALFVEGKYNEIGKTIKDTTTEWTNASIKTIRNSIIQEKDSLNKYKKIYEQTGTEIAEQQVKQAEQNLNNLANELVARTSTIEVLGLDEISAWKTLASNSYEEYQKALSQMAPEMQQRIQEITGIIASDTTVQTEAGNLADRVVSNFNRKNSAIETGKDIIRGLQEGIQDKYLQTELLNSSETLANNMIKKMNLGAGVQSPSKYTRQTGRFVDEGLILGLKDKEKEIINKASQISNSLVKEINKRSQIGYIDTGKFQGSLNNQIANGAKTIFTTPQIVFNVQELDEAKLNQCFNYINKKFGSAY